MKRILTLTLAALLVLTLLCGLAFADTSYIVDEEGLLTADEISELNRQAEAVSDRYQCSVNVLFTDSLDGKSAESYAEDYYDQNGLGYHGTNDGILLLVSMEERDYFITSAGVAQSAVTGSRLYTLEDAFLTYLSSGSYYEAVSAFISQCDYQLAHKDDPIEDEPEPEENTAARTTAGGVIAAITGFLGSLLPVGSMKAANNNVKKERAARNYVRDGSMQLYVNSDNFVRTETHRVRIQTDRDRGGGFGGGGGSSHVSSGGVSHTGGGGKF